MTHEPLEVEITAVIENDEPAIYVVRDGARIAKRGPRTKRTKRWISLELGWTVRDVGNYEGIEIEFTPA